MNVAVLGDGGWGTALALALLRNGGRCGEGEGGEAEGEGDECVAHGRRACGAGGR